MTIREYILDCEIKRCEMRLEKLKLMRAPEVLIASLEGEITTLKNGTLKVGGDASLLDETYEGREIKTGNGGKQYLQINGSINYFPNARYGRYIARAN